MSYCYVFFFFFFQAEDGIRDPLVTGVQTCALPIWKRGLPFAAQSRCYPGGVPGQLLFPAEPFYFIQTPKQVWMIWQRDHMVRRIYLTDKHSANVKPSWFGESIGHYENGDTLVVDTLGLSTKNSYIDNFRTPHTEKLHVV